MLWGQQGDSHNYITNSAPIADSEETRVALDILSLTEV